MKGSSVKTNEIQPAEQSVGITAKRLNENRERILCLWEERCIKEVDSAKAGASLALRDSIPIFLDLLSEALANNVKTDAKSVFARNKESVKIGKLHGAERAENKRYELTEVISEYHILRQVLFETLEAKNAQLDQNLRDTILDSIEQAVNDAAVEFSEIHTDNQQTFVNTLTHDLKNPITAAKMSAQMILKFTDIADSALSSAKRVISSMNRLEAMIHDLLDVSRLRNGESLCLQIAECDLNEILREVVVELSAIHGDRFKIQSLGSCKGFWDGNSLRRGIENLLGNAIKYSTPKSTISLSLKPIRKYIELVVHNEGTPIPEEEIPLLFQNFHRAKSANEGTKTGWGLGLTVVKGVIEAHKGKVRVESNKGKGTSFIIEIPNQETLSGHLNL